MFADLLQSGSYIGLVSPSHVADPDRYQKMIKAMERQGFRVKTGANLYRDTYGYSATEQERAYDFNAMFADDEVKMILFGGGEGANELLPFLDFENMKKHPKLVCSYSDGTTLLNSIYAKTGLITYYGQSPNIFTDLRQYDFSQFLGHFYHPRTAGSLSHNSDWITICPGEAQGILSGGYISNFIFLLNSRYYPIDREQEYLLFLEDHEKFHNMNEMSSLLAYLEQSGFLEHVTGLLFGHYSDPVNRQLLERLERLGTRFHIPVAYCDDFGHGVNHGILPIGVEASLETDGPGLNFLNYAEDKTNDGETDL